MKAYPKRQLRTPRFRIIRTLEARTLSSPRSSYRRMKLLQRRACGFKNLPNYRLRVIAQCD